MLVFLQYKVEFFRSWKATAQVNISQNCWTTFAILFGKAESRRAVVPLIHGDFFCFLQVRQKWVFCNSFSFKPEEFIFPHIQKGQHSSRLGRRADKRQNATLGKHQTSRVFVVLQNTKMILQDNEEKSCLRVPSSCRKASSPPYTPQVLDGQEMRA